MNRKPIPSLVFLSILALPASCRAGDTPANSDIGPAVDGNTAFAVALYREVATKEGNVFFSPYSLSTALAMTYGGARGETQKEMAKVLGFSPRQEEHHRMFAALQARLSAVQKRAKVRLSIANSLWCQRDYRFLDTFLNDMKTHYSSGLQTVDFVREAEAARQAINAWVEKETERKITELVGPGALDPLTRLVLCNAIYFKGNWASPFDVELTRWTDFFLAVDRPVNALMMRQEMEIKHKQLSGLAAAELPYKGDQLAMVVLLPTNRDGLAGLEKSLSAGNLKEWLGGIDKSGATSVMVSLPKFKTTSSFDLVENLEKMGMRSAFGQAADFSGMTGNRDLFISRILHKAFVEVNEEGTEAAAATSATGDGKDRGPEVMVFNANHPFIFLIRERQTGSILFMGRMADPTK